MTILTSQIIHTTHTLHDKDKFGLEYPDMWRFTSKYNDMGSGLQYLILQGSWGNGS